MNHKVIRIYVDTNVLINYCTGQKEDIEALNYIFSKHRKEVLFTSSLAVVQTISKLQAGSKLYSRKAYSRATTIEKLEEILSKFTVVDLSFPDIKESFNFKNSDIEDSVHFVLSQKVKCDAIFTNNKKDYVFFNDVTSFDNKLRFIKAIIS